MNICTCGHEKEKHNAQYCFTNVTTLEEQGFGATACPCTSFTPKEKVSECCGAPMIVAGEAEWEGGLATNHYECTKCGQACDPAPSHLEEEPPTEKCKCGHDRSEHGDTIPHPTECMAYPDDGCVIFRPQKKKQRFSPRARRRLMKLLLNITRGY